MSAQVDPTGSDAVALEVVRQALPLDICCVHTLPGHGAAGRCQLWAGHDGAHAVMCVGNGTRLVRTWSCTDPDGAQERADYRGLPWARGFPVPAWKDATA